MEKAERVLNVLIAPRTFPHPFLLLVFQHLFQIPFPLMVVEVELGNATNNNFGLFYSSHSLPDSSCYSNPF